MMERKQFLVTGASEGIGRATAIELSARGHRVIAVARSQARLESLCDEVGEGVVAVTADIGCPRGVESVVDALDSQMDVSGIVHSAGTLVPLESYLDVDPHALVEHFRVHVAAPISLCQAVIRRQSLHRMLFIDSYSASAPRKKWAAYSILKAAAQMAARCASSELSGVRSIRLFPGAVATRVVDQVLQSTGETTDVFAEMVNQGKCASPREAAAFIAALISDASDELLDSQESWDFNNPDDRRRLGGVIA